MALQGASIDRPESLCKLLTSAYSRVYPGNGLPSTASVGSLTQASNIVSGLKAYPMAKVTEYDHDYHYLTHILPSIMTAAAAADIEDAASQFQSGSLVDISVVDKEVREVVP